MRKNILFDKRKYGTVIFLIIGMLIISPNAFAQNKIDYLKKNRFDLEKKNFKFPQQNFNIIGFGAYHGSAKTEEAEYAMLNSLTKSGKIKYYLLETDFSIAHYFNEFLKTGDTFLLKDLVLNYGIRVPQEKSINTYEKWKGIKKLNDKLPENKKIKVVGIDLLVNYKYASKHLLELIDLQKVKQKPLLAIADMVRIDSTDYATDYNSYSKNLLKEFVSYYEKNPAIFTNAIKDTASFNHILRNLKYSFENTKKREDIIFENYRNLIDFYKFNKYPQFLRFGFFHLEKQREDNNASFFTKLIENKIYPREKVISVIGYLTESRVLWDIVYDKDKKYKSYTTEGGYGIGDYEKEYFRGIENLKNSKINDMTLFRLNGKDSPFSDKNPDLVEIIMTNDKSNGELVKGKSTTEFLDYAVLISNSEANVPIYELK